MLDRPHMTDGISASLEAVPVPPKFPCPECGSETREHGKAPRHDESERICSSPVCREIQPAPEEIVHTSPGDERPRFPCAKCGRETKVYRAGRIAAPMQRVCSNIDCRKIFDP